jgi:hypothetical protein
MVTEACEKTRHCKRPCCEAFKGGFPYDKVTLEKTKSQIITVLDIPESRRLNWLICIGRDTPAESFQHLSY